MLKKIPATIITGFLGAGKTTLVRHLMENNNGKRLALIVNEFGDVGVDGELLRSCGIEGCSDDVMVELSNGCLCCTVADDFIPAIEALLALPQRPDHILIETSGLALPKPLVQAFNWPEIKTKVTVDGVVSLVDARATADGLFAPNPNAVEAQRKADEGLDHETPLEELFEEQLGSADLILVNKTDLITSAEKLDVIEKINQEKRTAAQILWATQGQVDPRALLGLGLAAEDDLDSRPSHHDGTDEHEHDDFDTCVVSAPDGMSKDALIAKCRAAVNEFGLYRMKGFAPIPNSNMRLAIQGVGNRFQAHFDRDWAEGEDRQSRLVAIGQHGLDPKALQIFMNG
ncbi:MAG: cobalamin biosynthesis protein CobW [Alphaproteobacteria bacterium]